MAANAAHLLALCYTFVCYKVETTYPIAEGSTAGFLVLIQNLIQSIFLFVPTGPPLGTEWMNWTLVAVIPAFLVAMVQFEEKYTRTDRDQAARAKAGVRHSE